MHVFVTGAAGFIGRATITSLLAHNHTVLGLARSDANAATLKDLGASVHRGDLENADSLRSGAAQCDGVIHLGFVHDFTRFAEVCEIDRKAIQAMAEGLQQGKSGAKGKPLIVASGTLGLANPEGKVADEDTDDNRSMGELSARALSGDLVRELSKSMGLRGMIVRFSPNVHDKGDWGFGSMVIKMMKGRGESLYVEGTNACWPGAHRLDTAECLSLALETGQAGKTYHAIAEQQCSLKELAELIGRKLNVPVKGISAEEAAKELTFFGFLLSARNPTSSKKTRQELGWEPKEIGYLEDVEKHYFTEEMLNGSKPGAH